MLSNDDINPDVAFSWRVSPTSCALCKKETANQPTGNEARAWPPSWQLPCRQAHGRDDRGLRCAARTPTTAPACSPSGRAPSATVPACPPVCHCMFDDSSVFKVQTDSTSMLPQWPCPFSNRTSLGPCVSLNPVSCTLFHDCSACKMQSGSASMLPQCRGPSATAPACPPCSAR